MRRCIPRAVALLALVLAALIGGGTALAAPGGGGAPAAAYAAANVCRPNPSPPPGPNLMQVTAPVPGQAVVSPIVATGKAVAFEAQFRISLYDRNGVEIAAVPARTAEGQTLAPFVAMIPYSIGVEQDGCLWFYELSPRDGARVNIVQVPVHLLTGRGACFAEVRGLCIDPRFLPYWSQHGGLYQFGFPLAPAFVEREVDGKDYFVQYFERVRMEYHPENPAPYDILLGLLGDTVTADRRGEAPFQPRPRPAGCDAAAPICTAGSSAWFAATGHSLGEAAGGAAGAVIADQWIAKGGLPVYGYPISEVLSERGYDGNTYQVQYFERYRLEYHPDLAGTPYVVLLGQLGRQIYDAQYGGR